MCKGRSYLTYAVRLNTFYHYILYFDWQEMAKNNTFTINKLLCILVSYSEIVMVSHRKSTQNIITLNSANIIIMLVTLYLLARKTKC